jgi:hypothetical protein
MVMFLIVALRLGSWVGFAATVHIVLRASTAIATIVPWHVAGAIRRVRHQLLIAGAAQGTIKDTVLVLVQTLWPTTRTMSRRGLITSDALAAIALPVAAAIAAGVFVVVEVATGLLSLPGHGRVTPAAVVGDQQVLVLTGSRRQLSAVQLRAGVDAAGLVVTAEVAGLGRLLIMAAHLIVLHSTLSPALALSMVVHVGGELTALVAPVTA